MLIKRRTPENFETSVTDNCRSPNEENLLAYYELDSLSRPLALENKCDILCRQTHSGFFLPVIYQLFCFLRMTNINTQEDHVLL